MECRHDQVVVVGVDGSRAATNALQVAICEARIRRRPLFIAHAARVPLRRDAVLEAARSHAERRAPDLHVIAKSLSGSPSAVLSEVVAESDHLVVGARGLGGVGSVLFGSTSHALVRHAPCPVFVVRRAAERARRRVVVGVAGSTSADAAELAFDEASRRGAELVAVHAWDQPGASRRALLFGSPSEVRRRHLEEERVLDAVLEPWQAKYPDVPVRQLVTKEPAAGALVRWSDTADLVVVGRGTPGSRLPIGLTVLPVLRDSSCPVAVVPSR